MSSIPVPNWCGQSVNRVWLIPMCRQRSQTLKSAAELRRIRLPGEKARIIFG